jgi:transcriptional regulator with XRE-family HTH domain
MEQQSTDFVLHVARLNRGHSVRSLAAEIEIDARTLSRLEDGLPVHPGKAKKVADYFGVRVTDLMPLDREAA